MGVNNGAALKVIEKQTREYNALILEHNTLLKVHTKTVNDFADLEMKRCALRDRNKDLRALVVRFERDNERLQESLDQCQRDLLEGD